MGSPTPPRRQTDAAGRASRRGAQLRKSGASGAAQLQRPGTRGKEKSAEPAPRGSRALDSHGWRAAAALPPGAGAHSQLAVSPRRSIRGAPDRASFFASVPDSRGASGAGRGRGAQGPAGGGGLREDARRRARAARAAPALRRRLGRSAGAARGEPGLTGGGADLICLWQARHAAPPPLRRPALLSPVPSPRGRRDPERTRPGRCRRGLSRRAGRGGGAAPWSRGPLPPHPPQPGRLPRPLGPRAPSCSPRTVTAPTREGDGGRQTEKWGRKLLVLWGAPRRDGGEGGFWELRHGSLAALLSLVFGV